MESLAFMLIIGLIFTLGSVFILRSMVIFHIIFNYPAMPKLAINEYFENLKDFRIAVKVLILLFDLPIFTIIFILGVIIIMLRAGMKSISGLGIVERISKLYKYLVYRNK